MKSSYTHSYIYKHISICHIKKYIIHIKGKHTHNRSFFCLFVTVHSDEIQNHRSICENQMFTLIFLKKIVSLELCYIFSTLSSLSHIQKKNMNKNKFKKQFKRKKRRKTKTNTLTQTNTFFYTRLH